MTDKNYIQYPKLNTSLASKLQQFLFAKLNKNVNKVNHRAGQGG